jgi:glycosyltransferase involved in cell wall biosynthesis
MRMEDPTKRAVTISLGAFPPDVALPVDEEFADDFRDTVEFGRSIAKTARVVFVGMARSIAGILPTTIARLEEIGQEFASWQAVVVENDSADDTKDVLRAWQARRPGQVLVDCQDHGYEHLHGFEALRVVRYAILRNRYRTLAAEFARNADFVIAVDLDAWGGYSLEGVLHSVAMFSRRAYRDAACMASTSLYRAKTEAGKLVWGHYDLWALRMYGPRVRFDPWQPLWLPPPGARPIRVYSAFGALAVYRPQPFYETAYESYDGDIEHVGLHRNMQQKGWQIYLNPASRVVMHWLEGIELPKE